MRPALISGRTRRLVAQDLGIGLSALTRWIGRSKDRHAAPPTSSDHPVVTAEPKLLRRENDILSQERDILKRATAYFRPRGKSMMFNLIDQAKEAFSVHGLSSVLGISQSGYFAWKNRPASERQRQDMVCWRISARHLCYRTTPMAVRG